MSGTWVAFVPRQATIATHVSETAAPGTASWGRGWREPTVFEEYWDSLETQLAVALVVLLVAMGLVAVFLVVKLVRKHRQVNRPDTPFPVKFSYYASLLYAIFPVDLLPDPLLIDDVGVLLGALLYVGRALRRRQPERDSRPT
jgi:hypothetical protein